MHKALKVRIYPTIQQKTLIDKTPARVVLCTNMMLHERITFSKRKPKLSQRTQIQKKKRIQNKV